MVAINYLIVDRYPQFKQLARSKGTIPQETPRGDLEAGSPEKASNKDSRKSNVTNGHGGGGKMQKSPFMQEFFKSVGEIQNAIAEGKATVKQIRVLREDAMATTTQEQEKEISNQLDDAVLKTNSKIMFAKNKLEELKGQETEEEKSRMSPSESRIRQNMMTGSSKKLQQLVGDFSAAQTSFVTDMKQKATRQLRCALPEASDDELNRMVSEGQDATSVVTQRMAGAHSLLLDEVDRIRDKYQDIRKLEKNMADLNQMFVEMAQLVDHQGDLIDAIEVNVAKTKDYTCRAEKELTTARKIQAKNQRRTCCMTLVLLAVMMAILFPVIMSN